MQPNRPEGHFWTAANMGALAESFGLRAGLKYRKPIKERSRRSAPDPAFRQGSADRALGRWYAKVPGLFGGDDKLAEQHLRESLMYNPQQHRLALLSRRADARRRTEGRGARRTSEGPCRAAGPEWIRKIASSRTRRNNC